MQQSLRFGSVTLCTPSNGVDGYKIKYNPAEIDYDTIRVPGTYGRIQLQTGVGQTHETAASVEFVCSMRFDSVSALHQKQLDIQTKCTNTNNNLDTVYWSYFNDSSTYSLANCDLKYEADEYSVSQDPITKTLYYWLEFRIRCSQWGI